MIANSKEQKDSRSSRRIGRRNCLAGVTISLFLSGIALCVVLITLVVPHRECPSCPSFVSEDLKSVWIFMGVAYSLLISGGCIIVILTFRDRRINSPDGSFPEEVETPYTILPQDPGNSSAFVLPPPPVWPVSRFLYYFNDTEAVPSSYCVNCPEPQPSSYEEAVANEAQESTRESITAKKGSLILAFLALLCFGAGVFIFGAVIFLLIRERCNDCKQSSLGKSLSIVAFSSIVFGFGFLGGYCKRSKKFFTRPVAELVVVSAIPAENLEKSPAPVLHDNHVSPRHLYMSSASDLPDYFTAIRNIDGLYSAADAEESMRVLSTARKCSLILLIFALLCFGAGAFNFGIVIVLMAQASCSDCKQSSVGKSDPNTLIQILSTVGLSLFVLGFGLLGGYFRRSKKCCARQVAESVVISTIPAEDLEKSPAPDLQHNDISSSHLFFSTTSDLPDYFTAVANADNLYSTVDAGVWTEDVPNFPPPSYERALEMAALAFTTNEADTNNFKEEDSVSRITMV
ncbi:unnamed protein product [Pocillopora meandrina]|uniref:Transmembrane protein n=1 Tax=Pocillopora meandrina TaxID=46732 RepID=A0AAU9X3C1_9CNID|nr:unnamed protein product [Pocillopora meandrina]